MFLTVWTYMQTSAVYNPVVLYCFRQVAIKPCSAIAQPAPFTIGNPVATSKFNGADGLWIADITKNKCSYAHRIIVGAKLILELNPDYLNKWNFIDL